MAETDMAEAGTAGKSPSATSPAKWRGWLARSRTLLPELLLPASFVLWAVAVSRTNASELRGYGLLPDLPVMFYVGLALLVASIGREFGRMQVSAARMWAHAVTLVVMLYGTAPLLYRDGRYSWLYKTIGVVQYVNAHGQLDRHIDIYQNWPGFFAFTAWFDKIAGVSSPLGYAKWSQLAVELAALPLLSLCYSALFLPAKQRWAAILLYSAANWIGQDYFSPQALGTLLSLGILAITLRWLHAGNSAGNRTGDSVQPDDAPQEEGWEPPPRSVSPAPYLAVVLVIFFVLTFTHELSPYMLVVQVGALAVLRLARPRWLALAFAAIAIGYLIPRYSFVNSHYGLLRSIGAFFSNAAPPSLYSGPVPLSQRLVQYSADLLSLAVWGLAMAGAWLRRRSRRTVLTLLALTFSPVLLLGVQAYGEEGLLRVYLFSLPWAAALAAAVLAPLAPLRDRVGPRQLARQGVAALALGTRPNQGALRTIAALGVSIALFLPAFFGDDNVYVMPAGEVNTLIAFLNQARPGPIYEALDNAPLADTSRYNEFPLTPVFGPFSVLGNRKATASVASNMALYARGNTNGQRPVYVVITPSMLAYDRAYSVVPVRSFSVLRTSLAHSPQWKLVLNSPNAVIYELPPVAAPVRL